MVQRLGATPALFLVVFAFVGCDDFSVTAPEYRTTIVASSNVAQIVEEIGPVGVGIRLHLDDGSGENSGGDIVIEACQANPNPDAFMVRTSTRSFRPVYSVIPGADYVDMHGARELGTWSDVARPEPGSSMAETHATAWFTDTAPCTATFTVSIYITPLSPAFASEGLDVRYACGQEAEPFHFAAPIAEGPTVQGVADCSNPLGSIVELGPLTTAEGLREIVENYPPDAPRPSPGVFDQ